MNILFQICFSFIYLFEKKKIRLCPPGLTIMMNFDISIVAYVVQTTLPKMFKLL